MKTVSSAEVCKRGDKVEVEAEKGGLSKEMWVVLAYTDQMTRGVEVDDEVMERLKECFTDKEVVELTATVAAYNCVSRFLVALDVGERNGGEMKKVEDF